MALIKSRAFPAYGQQCPLPLPALLTNMHRCALHALHAMAVSRTPRFLVRMAALYNLGVAIWECMYGDKQSVRAWGTWMGARKS